MPIFVDRHDMHGLSAEDIANAHRLDLEVQKKYGVKFLTYWHDQERGSGFCLIDAPDKETAMRVHGETHGNVALDIVEADLSAVQAFLGRIADPATIADEDKSAIDSAFRAIMFTDIVGSTEMTARLGDLTSVEMVRAHDGMVRQALTDFDGREVKHMGDGIMASFDDVPSALGAAISTCQAIVKFCEGSREKLQIRIGIDAGEPIEDSNDLFGATVQLAARLCAAATPDSILVSKSVNEAATDKYRTRELGDRQLKGFADPVPVYEVVN
jgi:class 3 adenylate cyclase